MQLLQSSPWPPARLDAFNQLTEACLAYMVYDAVLVKLNITDATLLQRRAELGQHIKQTLGPAFRNA